MCACMYVCILYLHKMILFPQSIDTDIDIFNLLLNWGKKINK